jgi:hypothetical protein
MNKEKLQFILDTYRKHQGDGEPVNALEMILILEALLEEESPYAK